MSKMSIKVQVTLLVLVSLISLAIISAMLSSSKSKEALMKDSYSHLTTMRDFKKNYIEGFFAERIGDINVLSKSKDVNHILNTLIGAREELTIDPKKPYPVNDPIAVSKTKPFEEFFQNYMKEYGYYDVFIICAEHGHVMYSAAKESDYGANLVYGELKNSGLAEAYHAAIKNKRPTFIDMKPYIPSNNAPAMFLSTPVYTEGEIKAVLVFQVSDAAINNIMQYRKGYGKSQEDYLLGEDKLMRSDSYLDPKNHSLQASFANPAKGLVDTEASRSALNGQSDTKIVMDYNGNPVLSSYSVVKIGEDFKWAIISEIDEAEVLITPNSIRNSIVLSSIILLIVIIFISIAIINFSVVKPIEKFKSTLVKIGDNSDLTIKVDENSPKELSQMANSFNGLISKLKDLIETSKQSSSENASISHELSTTSMGVGKNVEKSVEIIEEATNKANSIKTEIDDSIVDAVESKKDIVKANDNLQSARDDIISLTSKVQETAQVEVEMSHSMETLSKDADEVKTVLTIISDIADQTNLLALNAAIEAARAGEHGRGFAVVADEVRKLAERTQKTLSEINATINVVVQSIGDASTQMINNSDEIQELANVAQNVEDKINSTVELVNEAVRASDKTVADFEKTGNDIEIIVRKVAEINEISGTNARSVEEISAASDHLNSMTNELNSKLDEFRT